MLPPEQDHHGGQGQEPDSSCAFEAAAKRSSIQPYIPQLDGMQRS